MKLCRNPGKCHLGQMREIPIPCNEGAETTEMLTAAQPRTSHTRVRIFTTSYLDRILFVNERKNAANLATVTSRTSLIDCIYAARRLKCNGLFPERKTPLWIPGHAALSWNDNATELVVSTPGRNLYVEHFQAIKIFRRPARRNDIMLQKQNVESMYPV